MEYLNGIKIITINSEFEIASDEVLETSTDMARLSVDGTKTFVKLIMEE